MRIFKIEENDANQRLDKFLKKLFPNATRSLIYKLNRKDKIKIFTPPSIPPLIGEGRKIEYRKKDNEYKLQIGDEVKIFLNDKDFDLLMKVSGQTQGLPLQKKECRGEPCVHPNNQQIYLKNKFNKNDIVFEDADLLVVNKNSGINVHAGDHKTKEIPLINQVQDYLGDKLNSLTFKPSLVHRIDRDTSGILIIAKKKDILTKLVKDFKEHSKIKKTYYAIVLGRLSRKTGTIKKNLKRIENAKDENKVQVSESGQTAITHYKLLKEHILKSEEKNIIISEIEVEIETGRMHQIRVHLSSIGNPILGDKIYGDKKMNSFFARNYGLNRQALHSWKIKFFHYNRNKNIELQAKIKKDLTDFIKNING